MVDAAILEKIRSWDGNEQLQLYGANLRDANLQGAYLQGADLRDANLHGANLRGANFRDAKNIPALIIAQLTIVIEGRMQGWKALRGDVIAFLEIPTHAKRSNATGRKCRASEAHVVALYDKYGAPVQAGVSKYDATFDYHVGETVHCHAWEEDRWVECGGGIHFYLTREEAERD